MAVKNYVATITPEQAEKLQNILEHEEYWDLDDLQYARFRARKDKTTVVAYESGKLVVQGKGTEDLVQFILEPRVLLKVTMGYESVIAQDEDPKMFEPHAGMDESGKGDFFGPMIAAACYTDEVTTQKLYDLGVQDSKNIKSDKKIFALSADIRNIIKGRFTVVRLGNPSYNKMFSRAGNVNKMLAWAHARCLENLLERVPDCPRALLDQFAKNERTVTSALMERGKQIVLDQRTKAESDIAVAAASIIAREEFILLMDEMGKRYNMTFPRGASSKVLDTAVQFIKDHGVDELNNVAKFHFRTTQKAILISQGKDPSIVDQDKKPWKKW